MGEKDVWLPAGLRWSDPARPEKPGSEEGRSSGDRSERAESARSEAESSEPVEPSERAEPVEPVAKGNAAARKPRPQRQSKPKRTAPKATAKRGNPERKREHKENAERKRRAREQHLHAPSDVDALGQEKHRKVVGKRFGLSRSRQFLFYGIFLAFVALLYIGGRIAVDELDKAPAHDPDRAPWSKPGAPQGPLGGFEPDEPGQKGPTDFQ